LTCNINSEFFVADHTEQEEDFEEEGKQQEDFEQGERCCGGGYGSWCEYLQVLSFVDVNLSVCFFL
jgi:hypothetical protein